MNPIQLLTLHSYKITHCYTDTQTAGKQPSVKPLKEFTLTLVIIKFDLSVNIEITLTHHQRYVNMAHKIELLPPNSQVFLIGFKTICKQLNRFHTFFMFTGNKLGYIFLHL